MTERDTRIEAAARVLDEHGLIVAYAVDVDAGNQVDALEVMSEALAAADAASDQRSATDESSVTPEAQAVGQPDLDLDAIAERPALRMYPNMGQHSPVRVLLSEEERDSLVAEVRRLWAVGQRPQDVEAAKHKAWRFFDAVENYDTSLSRAFFTACDVLLHAVGQRSDPNEYEQIGWGRKLPGYQRVGYTGWFVHDGIDNPDDGNDWVPVVRKEDAT